MAITVITSLSVPSAFCRVLRLFGVVILSWRSTETRLDPTPAERFHKISPKIWVEAQIRFKRDLDLTMSEVVMKDSAAESGFGVTERGVWNFVGQRLAADFLYPYNFITVARSAYPNARIIGDFPPPLAQRLFTNVPGYLVWLSRLAWRLRRARHALDGFLANAIYLLRTSRLAPQGNDVEREGSIVVWINSAAGEFDAAPDGLNISDFVAGTEIPFLREADTILIEGEPAWRHRPPVRIVTGFQTLARRPVASGNTGRGRLLSAQTRNAVRAVFGPWWEAMIAKDTAALSVWECFYDTVRPTQIAVTISSAIRLPLHVELARHFGAAVHLIFESTQLRHSLRREDWTAGVVTDIYLWLAFDRYAVWDDQSAEILCEFGVDPDKIDRVGPVILSSQPKPAAKMTGNLPVPLIIDVYDQQPLSHEGLQFVGAPDLPHGMVYLEQFFTGLVQALEIAFMQDTSPLVRIKTKRLCGRYTHPAYASLLSKIKNQIPNCKILASGVSPLVLHETAVMSIGVPFVSPVISSQYFGTPACFFDPTGNIHCDDGQSHDMCVFSSAEDLGAWMAEIWRTLHDRPAQYL